MRSQKNNNNTYLTMASNKKIQLPIYTYEFIPVEKPEDNLFEKKEDIARRNEQLKLHKQEILQKYIDQIATGELVPRMGEKSYRCKTIYNLGGITILKIENVKDEVFPWDFASQRHMVAPYCHVIIDNRKDMQHIAIEPNKKAFSSTNVVKNILAETLRPLIRKEGLILDINGQFQPKAFWDYIDANRQYGIKEIRFYFPYPNLPAISDKYGNAMMEIGLDYHCMPGVILFAPDDLDMVLDRDDLTLKFWLEAAAESGINVAVQTKRKNSRVYYVGKNNSVKWTLEKNVLELLDPRPEEAHQKELKMEFLEEDEKACVQEKIAEFLNNGRFSALNAK